MKSSKSVKNLLSINGYRTNSWNEYLSQFNYFKKNINLIQTDLVCVKKSFMAEFHRAFNN